jgi:hypothetical protein
VQALLVTLVGAYLSDKYASLWRRRLNPAEILVGCAFLWGVFLYQPADA